MKKVLILEDNLDFVTLLLSNINTMAIDHNEEIETRVVTTHKETVALEADLSGMEFNAVILDFFAPDGNFHIFNIEQFGAEKIISISSAAHKNKLAADRGVQSIVAKDYRKLGTTSVRIVKELEKILFSDEM